MKYAGESEDDDQDDYPPPEYHPEADDAGILWCPNCGAEMHGDSVRCAKCGDYVTPGARPTSSMPWWIWAGLILVGVAMTIGILSALRY